MRATFLVLAVVLAASVLGQADDGSVPWPTESAGNAPLSQLMEEIIQPEDPTPQFVYYQWETWTVSCTNWEYLYTEVRCNVTHRCFFRRGCYWVFFYYRTCLYYQRECLYAWPSGDRLACGPWLGPYYRTEIQDLDRTFVGECGCDSASDCPQPMH